MLRAYDEHVAITIQTSDAKLVGGWEGVRFFSPVGRLIMSITVYSVVNLRKDEVSICELRWIRLLQHQLLLTCW
jgi:hypothetical protein